MANDIGHERYRFSTMNENQLRTRLGKITDRVKLRNFITMCAEYGYTSLMREAERKLYDGDRMNPRLTGRNLVPGVQPARAVGRHRNAPRYGRSPAERSQDIINNLMATQRGGQPTNIQNVEKEVLGVVETDEVRYLKVKKKKRR